MTLHILEVALQHHVTPNDIVTISHMTFVKATFRPHSSVEVLDPVHDTFWPITKANEVDFYDLVDHFSCTGHCVMGNWLHRIFWICLHHVNHHSIHILASQQNVIDIVTICHTGTHKFRCAPLNFLNTFGSFSWQ